MRKIISYQEFLEEIGVKRVDNINQAFRQGFQDSVDQIYHANQLGVPVEYEVRTKAGIAHDHIKARLRALFQDDLQVEINKWNGIFGWKFEEFAFCRVKKFNNGCEVAGIMTHQQEQFRNQHQIPLFPSEPTFITLGYYTDKPWTKLLGVYASCVTADGLIWFSKLGGEGFTQTSAFGTPIVPIIPVSPLKVVHVAEEEKKKRIKAKKNPKKDTGTDNPASDN